MTGRIGPGPMLLLLALVILAVFPRAARADEFVESCGSSPNFVFVPISRNPIGASASCPGAIELQASSASLISQGENAIVQASAPPGLFIRSVWIPSMASDGVNEGSAGAYGGDFYWGSTISNITPNENSAVFSNIDSQDFGVNLVCGKSSCSGYSAVIGVAGVLLTVGESSGPVLSSPSGLWQSAGWVRGRWTLAFSGDSPSGMCSLTASLAGQALPGSSSSTNPALWHQCAAAAVNDPVDTTSYPDGPDTLQIGGTDAAAVPSAVSKTIWIDNQQPTVSLAGPADAPSTAGTQYVTATATAGPSGVAGIGCSLDNGPAQWFGSSTAQVAVNGVGEHQVQCFSENNAVDANGAHGSSPIQSFAIKIGVPTVTAISFSKLVDRLRCHRALERIHVPARWVTVRRHHKRLRVHRRARTRLKRVVKCHARTALRHRTVWATVRRHGKKIRVKRKKTVRVILVPHVVNQTSRRVDHDRTTTVNGWVGTYTGTALGGQTVEVLAAPDNGQGAFAPVATTTTAPDGSWSVPLPAGPSQLIEASYAGTPNVEPSLSGTVKEIVPAKVRLISVTRRVPWGGTVRIVGQLKGGYLPPGGALVRLRIGEEAGVTTYGVKEHVHGNGRFSTRYTFGAGDPSVHRSFFFQLASLPTGNYPWAPGVSRRLTVIVGGHPKSSVAAQRSCACER